LWREFQCFAPRLNGLGVFALNPKYFSPDSESPRVQRVKNGQAISKLQRLVYSTEIGNGDSCKSQDTRVVRRKGNGDSHVMQRAREGEALLLDGRENRAREP